MQIIKIATILFMGVFLTSCGCNKSYMPENYIVKEKDKHLNCNEIIYAINETEFWIKNVNERCMRPHVFAKFLPCIPMVKLDAMRNEYTLSDRADYLRSLYKLKGCELSLKLKQSSIETQSTSIGLAHDKLTTKYNNTKKNSNIIIFSKNHIIADLPANS